MTARQKSRLVSRRGRGEFAVQRLKRLARDRSRAVTASLVPAPTGAPTALHFSVILCTYNRRRLVLNSLASLRRQTLPFSAFEVIVVDNGSRDGTLSAVRTYANAGRHDGQKTDDIWNVHCLSEQRRGLAYARNTGMLAASGEVVVFLDDDTVADPRFLEYLWQAYVETGAEAVGARVELQWERGARARPHWLADDMLDTLGYFSPAGERVRLDPPDSFSSCCFSIKVEALRAVGSFSPFLSKRPDLPASIEVRDLCQRLHANGYALWFEPAALVVHRAPAARLTRPFFVGRAYWQGRSEVLADYRNHGKHETLAMIQATWRDLRIYLHHVFIHRPLLRLAGRSSSEQLYAAMQRARAWGRFQQRLSLLEHAPAEREWPAICFVYPPGRDDTASLLLSALSSQDIRCTPTTRTIPIAWLWQHRAHRGRAIGILHLYRPGMLALTHRQQQQLWFRVWLAHRWGIHIITTDAGGYWQSARGLRFLSQRAFERQLMQHSDAIMGFTRQPEQLYLNRRLRSRLRCLPHPGFGDYLLPLMPRDQARHLLDFPPHAGTAILCLAFRHTERELLHLVEAFLRAKQGEQEEAASRVGAIKTTCSTGVQLMLVGPPCDKAVSKRIIKLAARQPALHLHLSMPDPETLSLYLASVDALALPHFAVETAGLLESAMLALSYGRVAVVPNLPRFRGMLPPRATIYYDPSSRESLAQALLEARQRDYRLTARDREALDARSGWEHYAARLVKVYREVLE
jgi:glycosyltransferase involved in cell wall biosynthesis